MSGKRRVLVSVTNKALLAEFRPLLELGGWEFISTGGTATELRKLGFPVTDVSAVTGFPEGMDGRIKTLHPKVFGGILADRDQPSHLAFLMEHGLVTFDMVVVNLYDFDKKPGIENIDVGGPSMLRAAAKNHKHVIVVCDPADYRNVVRDIEVHGDVAYPRRYLLAQKAFQLTSDYDASIARWFGQNPSDADVLGEGPH